MNRLPSTSAIQNFENDRHASEGFAVSLHRIWRSVGSPPDKSPAEWLHHAKGLVTAMAGYQQALCETYAGHLTYDVEGRQESMLGEFMEYEEDLVRTFTPEDAQGRKSSGATTLASPGDTLACVELAFLYAMFLDEKGLADVVPLKNQPNSPDEPEDDFEDDDAPFEPGNN